MRLTNTVGRWNWRVLSRVIPIEYIRAYPDLPWDRYGLSTNKDITVEAMDYLDDVMTNAVGQWNWRWLSQYIPMSNVRAHPNLPWDKWMLTTNPGVTVDDVIHMDIGVRIGQTVSMEEIKANPSMVWDKQWMSGNPRITMEMVLANPD